MNHSCGNEGWGNEPAIIALCTTSSGKQLLDGQVYEDLSYERSMRRLHLIASMYPSPGNVVF